MIKKTLFITYIYIVFFSLFGFSEELKSEWGTITSGGGTTASGGSYVSVAGIIGQPVVGVSTETASYGSLVAGFISAFVEAESTTISFYDPSPSASQENETYPITAKITIEASSNDIAASTVKVRISTSGPSVSNFSEWFNTGMIADTTYTAQKIRYSINIPTSTSGVSFASGENNYIQWRAKDTAANEAESAMYQVRLAQSDIEIVQPIDYSSLNPMFEVEFFGAVQQDSIDVQVRDQSGNIILTDSGSANYNSQTNKYQMQSSASPNFIANTQYTFTITVRDISGSLLTDNSDFIVNDGMIADLIPYPSPSNDPHNTGITLRYVLKQDSYVTISIYNTSGNLVYEIIDNEFRTSGMHDEDKWYGRNFASQHMANGIYFCEIIAENSEGEYKSYTALAVLKE